MWRLALNSHLTFGPAYDAARAYFPIEGDRLTAYEMLTGKQLWIVDSHSALQPVAVDDLVVVTGPDGIAALRAADGSRAWHVPLEEPLTFKPATARGWLLAPTKSGALVALRTSDGAIAWRRTFTSPPHATPTIRADRFYISLADGRIAAHELKTGEPIWERRVGGSANEILALDERVYAGSTDNFLYCLLAKDGKIDWRWRTGGDVTKAPAADGRAVYFASSTTWSERSVRRGRT